MPDPEPATISRSQFGKALRRARKDARLSQSALGALIGTNQGQISDYEVGRYVPSRETVARLRQALPDLPAPDARTAHMPIGSRRGPQYRSPEQLAELPPDARQLYLARIERGLTISEVAGKAGIDMTYLSAVERGRRPLSARLRARLTGVVL